MRGITLPGRLRRRQEREAREIAAAHRPCETAENGTGARCTCSFDCANYWLRAKGHAGDDGRPGTGLLAAPVAELESPPGSLTPQARRQLDEALAEGALRAAAARRLVVKTGERPYPGIAASQLAASRFAAASGLPAPAFDPAPGRAPATAPMPVLPANAMVPPPPPAAPLKPVPVASEEVLLLRRVHEAMLRKWRAESFIADKRELPCFAATTRTAGWLGLHRPPRSFGWPQWSTERWADRERALAAAAHVKALAELDVVHARYAAEAAVEGGSR